MGEFFAYLILAALFLAFYIGLSNHINGNKSKKQSIEDKALQERLEIQTKRSKIGSPRRRG